MKKVLCESTEEDDVTGIGSEESEIERLEWDRWSEAGTSVAYQKDTYICHLPSATAKPLS